MADITDDLWVTVAGSTTIATDEMLASLEHLRAMSSALATIGLQLSIADATLTESTRALTQVGRTRAAMEDAWVAKDSAKGICDYVAGSLVTAAENYTETERNSEWLAQGVDSVLALLVGLQVRTYLDVLGPWGSLLATFAPVGARDTFDDNGEPISARDVPADSPLAAMANDPDFVAWLRRMVMTGGFLAVGLGEVPASAAALFRSTGDSGVALSGDLLVMYAAMAGMLTETGVKVTATSSYSRPGPVDTSTESRLDMIPNAGLRGDGAQIRIDEIHDGDTVRYEVFIAGTADFNPFSGTEPFDMASNVAGVVGDSPASYRAVQLAMDQAGITAEDAVSFVGHSQGALIATMLAASGEYNTQGLTTIGSPAGQIIVPKGIPALIIDHFEDPVTALGGTQANTDATVVQRYAFSEDHPADTTVPVPGHQIETYLETARMIDAADSEKLQSTVDELNAFADGEMVTSTFYFAERTG